MFLNIFQLCRCFKSHLSVIYVISSIWLFSTKNSESSISGHRSKITRRIMRTMQKIITNEIHPFKLTIHSPCFYLVLGYNKSMGAGPYPDPTLLLWLSPNSLIKAALIKAPMMSSIRLSNHLDRAAGFRLRRFLFAICLGFCRKAPFQSPHALLPYGCGHYSPASLAANCAARSAFSGLINTLL